MPVGKRFAGIALVLLSGPSGAMSGGISPTDTTPWRPTVLLNQWRRIPESDAVATTAITHDERIQEVTLKETIGIALENNPGIAARRLEPGRLSAGVTSVQGQYDPTFSADVRSAQTSTPNTSSLSRTSVSNLDDRYANARLSKFFRTGTELTLESLNERIDNNATFNALRPQYKPGLNLSLVQPLLRGFGWDFSYLVVRVVEQTADAAIYQYEAQVADFVTTVIDAYWNVVRTREQLEVQRESKALADRTVSENEARVKVGLLPPVAVLEAQADAMSRQQQVIIAENSLALARQRLAQLAYFRPDNTFVPRTLEPVEPTTVEELKVNVDEGLSTALQERPEVLASKYGVRARQLNEHIAENGLLPRLDVVGSYGVNAVSGTQRAGGSFLSTTNTVGDCDPIRDSNNVLIAYNCRSSPSAFGGSTLDAYDRLTSGDFRSYSFGLQLQMPLSNATARGEYTQRRVETNQAELNHRELLSNVTLEVRQAAADVAAARQAVDTSRVARELAAENLRQQEKRHEVGMTTTKDLLDFQTRLTSARASEVQSRIAYLIASSRWRRAQGKLLAHYQIVVERPSEHFTPWWARF